MNAQQAANTLLARDQPEPEVKTLILDGAEVKFPKDQAERMLAYQKLTGFTDYSEPTADADHRQPSDSLDSNPAQPESAQTGAD